MSVSTKFTNMNCVAPLALAKLGITVWSAGTQEALKLATKLILSAERLPRERFSGFDLLVAVEVRFHCGGGCKGNVFLSGLGADSGDRPAEL